MKFMDHWVKWAYLDVIKKEEKHKKVLESIESGKGVVKVNRPKEYTTRGNKHAVRQKETKGNRTEEEMTTIAYKDGIIAYDSRETMGNQIITDSSEKRIDENGVSYFPAGAIADIHQMIGLNSGSQAEKVDCCAIAVEGGKLYYTGKNDDDGFWRSERDLDIPFAIGSGSEYALGAMDSGCTAEEAVKIAAGRDTGTGGKIRTFKI